MNKERDLVTVVVPSYNSEKYIEDSLRSVLKQTYDNFEIIVIDDCSTDNTVEIIKSLKDNRIKLIVNTSNIGAALSRNKAIKNASGKYIAFLDSDDIWLPEKLEKQLKFMKENNYFFSFTDYRVCRNGKWDNFIITAPSVVNYRKILNYCYFFTSTVIYDREKIGLIEIPDLKKRNDWALWIKALEKVDAHRFPYCLSYYIKHNNSISSGSKLSLIKYHYQVYRKVVNKSKFSSFFLTINNLWHGFWKRIIYRKRIKNT